MPPRNLISRLLSQLSSQSILGSGEVGASDRGRIGGPASREKGAGGNPFSINLLLRRSTCSLTSSWWRATSESMYLRRICPAVVLNLRGAPPPFHPPTACPC